MNKINEFFESITMTIISVLFMAASIFMMLIGVNVTVDPALASIVISGFPLAYEALTMLVKHRKITSSLLITIAMAASIFIGEYFAAAEIAVIMAAGELLEDMTVSKSKKGVNRLIELYPATARRLKNGIDQVIPADEVKKGDILRILPGERIPVDGIIVRGTTTADESVITGEALPSDKDLGDMVYCGTINSGNAVDISASAVGEDSSFGKMISLLENAEHNKAPVERIADKWSEWLVLVSLTTAVITGLITGDIVKSVTILVVFCPCALALSTPTAVAAAIGQASKKGIIIKSGSALEAMGKVNLIAFDKTGTITKGNLKVSGVYFNESTEGKKAFMSLVFGLEKLSEHPIAKAFTAYAENQELEPYELSEATIVPGRGIKGEYNGMEYLCGNEAFIKENNIKADDKVISKTNEYHKKGMSTLIFASKEKTIGVIAFADEIRPAVPELINSLTNKLNIKTVLLTGDNERTAEYVTGKTGITDTYSSLLPAEKLGYIESFRKNGMTAAMVGDGVNDAPALKTADVGIAVSTMASDIAYEASDISITGDDIGKVAYIKRLSNAAVKIIKINITLAVAINLAAVILSIMGMLNPVTGALVHNIGSVLVILNAVLLYDRNYE